MICKTCKKEYTKSDPFTSEEWMPEYGYSPNALMNQYGWSERYGDCYQCFLHAAFGDFGMPWGRGDDLLNQFYTITPLGVPSQCYCEKDFEKMVSNLKIQEQGDPNGELPF